MVAISIKADTLATRRLMQSVNKQLPYATAVALTRTAKAAQGEVVKELPRVFDRPTRWTLGSTFVQSATKRSLEASIGFKGFRVTGLQGQTLGFDAVTPTKSGTPAAVYLAPQVYGGRRLHKRFENALIRAGIMRPDEFAVPGDDVRLDQYGNIRRGEYTAMMSQLRALADSASFASKSRRSKASRRTKAFFYRPEFRGIFVRTGKRAFTVFLKFVRKPRYGVKLKFEKIVTTTADARFDLEFRRALDQAVATAR